VPLQLYLSFHSRGSGIRLAPSGRARIIHSCPHQAEWRYRPKITNQSLPYLQSTIRPYPPSPPQGGHPRERARQRRKYRLRPRGTRGGLSISEKPRALLYPFTCPITTTRERAGASSYILTPALLFSSNTLLHPWSPWCLGGYYRPLSLSPLPTQAALFVTPLVSGIMSHPPPI
jgi:hypothetical protein